MFAFPPPHTHTHPHTRMSTVLCVGVAGRELPLLFAVVILVITTKIIIVVVVVPGTAAAVVIVVSANIVIRVACYAKTKPEPQPQPQRGASCRVASNKMWQHLAAFFDLPSFVFV